MLLPATLLDFAVWDNDAVGALITFVAVAFAIVLILVVLRQKRSPEEEAAIRERAQQALQRQRQSLADHNDIMQESAATPAEK
jgi:large-conductance mechanosensitive channel